MRNLLLAIAFAFIPVAALADNVGGSGTQPYACTVVGDSSINMVSTGQNQLTASGSGSVTQNGDTTYSITTVTTTGPDTNLQASTTVIGNTLNLSSTELVSDSQAITGELSESVTYNVSLSSSDGILEAGAYTTAAELTCTATP